MRLRQLFFLLSLLLSLTVVAMTVGSVRAAWQDLRKVSAGQEAMQQLQALLYTAEMASRERGPANGVLGDDLPGDPNKRDRLNSARALTDTAFEVLQRSMDASSVQRSAVRQAVEQARLHLVQARQAIGNVAQKERRARSPDEIRSAVSQMINVIDDLAPAMISLTDEAQACFPTAADALTAARLAANLREYAGQLGSQFTAPLTTRQLLSAQERVTIERIRGRIEQLRQQLTERTTATDDRAPVKAAAATMLSDYFGSAIRFVDAQTAIGLSDGKYEVDTAEFAARYVPDMDSIVALRDVLMSEALADAQRGMDETRSVALWMAGGGLLTICFLGVTLRLIHRRIVRPLGETKELIVAIADGHLDLKVPTPKYRDELAEMLDAIAVLRQNSAARLELEKERQRLVEQLNDRNRYLVLNNHVLEKLGEGIPLNQLLNDLMKVIEEEHPGAICTVLLANEEGTLLQHAAASGMPESWIEAIREVKIGEGVGSCGTAAHRRERVIVEDVQTHPFWTDFREAAQKAGLRSCWSQPFMDAHGKLLGTFAIYHHTASCPDDREIQQIEEDAKLVAFIVERARLADALKDSQMRYQLIADNSNDVIWLLDMPSMKFSYLSPSMERLSGMNARDLIGKTISSVMKPEAEAQIKATVGEVVRQFAAGEVLASDLTLEHQLRHKDGHEIPVELVAKILLDKQGVPLRVVGITRDISERKAAEETIRQMAYYDRLTGLPNRRLLEDRMQQVLGIAKRKTAKVSVLFIDLDKFKQVNDLQGHEAGDWLLQQVAQRMQSVLRKSDTAARVGGDEFVVLLPDAGNVKDAVSVAEKIRLEMENPFIMGSGVKLEISSSIGVVMYPDQADNPRDLLRYGDEAMYRAKKKGRNAVEVFA